MYIQSLFENPKIAIPVTLLIIFSICLHEYMHAFTAWKCGDDTAVSGGHLTLNPLKQMGLFSLIMLALFGFCWGAVPVNWENLPRRSSRMLVALAGPLTNLVLGLSFFLVTAGLFRIHFLPKELSFILRVAVRMNLFLFIFNLVPIPGFDGYLAIFDRNPPAPTSEKARQFRNAAFFIAIIVLLHFNAVKYIFEFCDRIILALWKLFIPWFA